MSTQIHLTKVFHTLTFQGGTSEKTPCIQYIVFLGHPIGLRRPPFPQQARRKYILKFAHFYAFRPFLIHQQWRIVDFPMESSHVLLLFANNTILISSSGGAQTSWCETSRSSSRYMTDSVSIMTSSLLSPNFKHILVFGLNFCSLTLSLSSQLQITTMQLTQQYACSYSKVVEIVKEVIACDNVLSWFLYFSPSSPKQEVDRSC